MTSFPSEYAPILLFTYKRLDSLTKTVTALQQNYLARESELFIFSDGPKQTKDTEAILDVRNFISTITGFKKIHVIESPENKGLSSSIIQGVSKIIAEYGKVIVLEDDLVTSPNFLDYMNKALLFYQNYPSLFAIAGFSMPIETSSEADVYFTHRASSWGWATWQDRWKEIDWEVKDYETFKFDTKAQKAFNAMGSDMTQMLGKQMAGKINSWAIRWCYHQFKNGTFSVHPVVSKVSNIGFGEGATHTREKFDRFKTHLDASEKTSFHFSHQVALDPKIIKQFVKPYSIASRIKYKLLNALPF